MAYLTIGEAIAKHGKSESSYRRLIRQVRKSGDAAKRRLIRPSEEEIKQHRAAGEPYAYTIAEELIEQELLGKSSEQGSEQSLSRAARASIEQIVAKLEESHTREIAQIEARHEREIARMERIQQADKEEKRQLLEHAREDKKLFADAAKQLTQVLALPGITEATRAQTGRPLEGTAVESRKQDRQGSEQTEKRDDSSTTDNRKRPRWLSRVFRGRKF